MGAGPSTKLSSKPRLRQRQQVAAVCYRLRGGGIEFLLVQTRGGRWIFPKGGVEPGLTHAESAALEALEEAGVHGRMENISFTRYFRKLPTAIPKSRAQGRRSSDAELAVAAHLCEVSRLEPPQEAGRNPTWFSADKAKQRLLKDRGTEFGSELARVVDRAFSRIQRLHSEGRQAPDRIYRDGLQKVRFEALEDGRLHNDLRKAVLARHSLGQRDARSSVRTAAAVEAAVQAYFQNRPMLRLGTGGNASAAAARNVTAIDAGRRANSAKSGSTPVGKCAR